jgi:hypothetical protein
MRGNALAIQVERNICLFRCEKGLLNVLQRKYKAHSKIVFDPIRELMTAPGEPKRRVGFHS